MHYKLKDPLMQKRLEAIETRIKEITEEHMASLEKATAHLRQVHSKMVNTCEAECVLSEFDMAELAMMEEEFRDE